MSLSSIQKYSMPQSLAQNDPPFFELEHVQLEKSCIANQDHRSVHYKVFFLADGQGEYSIDFNEFSIDGAGLFFLSPGQILKVQSEAVRSGYLISFNREFYCVETHGKEIACNGVLFNNVHRSTYLQLADGQEIIFQRLVDQMIQELGRTAKAHQEMLEAYLRMMLIEALRIHDEQKAVVLPQQEDSSPLASDFIALVEKHFRTDHAVSAYADRLFVSPKSLTKRLKAHGYKTPTEIIRDRIVLEAKRELRYTQKTVKEIAFELGFDDPAYFTRYFKKASQLSPQGYRDTYLG